MFSISESVKQCVGCKEKVKIKWKKVKPTLVLEMKINKKSQDIELQKSPLVLEPYDPLLDPDTCIFEGNWEEIKNDKKETTPITVLGCPNAVNIEVSFFYLDLPYYHSGLDAYFENHFLSRYSSITKS